MIALLNEHYPGETFVRWQASELDCPIVVGEIIGSKPSQHQVFEIGQGNGYRGHKLERVKRRLLEGLLSSPGPKWCSKTEANWNKFLLEHKPKVVLACFGTNAVRALDGCKKYKVPLVVQFLGQDASRHLRRPSFVKGVRQVYEYASAVVVLNPLMKDRLVESGCRPDKIHVLPIGVRCGVPRKTKRFSEGSTFEFLGIGRFVEKKSPIATLRAFQQCHRQNCNVRLTMIGDGPLYEKSQQFANEQCLNDVVSLPGRINHDGLVSYWDRAHCFVQHSVTASCGDAEGWPVAIAEAASHGLPIVSTRHEGIPSEVIEGESGYLVDEHDWQTMAQRMLELSQNLKRCADFGQAGQAHILENGNLTKQCEKLLSILNSCASSTENK